MFVTPRIRPCQHVFVKAKSCKTQLLHVHDDVGKILETGGQTVIIDILLFCEDFDDC